MLSSIEITPVPKWLDQGTYLEPITNTYYVRATRFEINDANSYLDEDASHNITITDAVTGTKTLAQLAAGITTFVGLADTPANFTGASLQYARVNVGETAIEFATIAGGGDLLADGSVPLTANWDVGAYTIQGTQFISDIAIGTAPLVVTSTTVVANLNADTVDGVQAASFLLASGATALAGAWSMGNQATTNVNIDSGAIDGVTIGGAAAPTVTDLGSVATCDINGGTIDGVTIGGAAAPTVTDLGSVATADINGGTIGAVTLDGTLTMAEVAILLDPALSADGKHCGITEGGTAGAILAYGDLCYFQTADSKWELANADNATAGHNLKLGICVLAAAENAATTMLLYGKVRADTAFPDITIGAPVYMAVVAGNVQVAAPSGSTDIVRIVGYGNTINELFFSPDNTYIEIA